MNKPAYNPEQEADTLMSELLFRLHRQELALKALDFLVVDGRFAPDERLEVRVDCLSGLFGVLETHAADTLKIADRLESAMNRAAWPKAA